MLYKRKIAIFVPRALRGTKMPVFEVKSDEIQTSTKID